MEKEQRNRLQKATQDARRLLEEEFRGQLLQTYDIDVEKVRWAEEPGAHLQAEQRLIREKLVAWIEHKEAQINDRKEALLLVLREMAFTALNRFVALKLMEARELVRPCVSGALESAGFLEFTAVAQGLLADQESSYRLYLETIFEDVSRELRALFDPRDPASLLWPKRAVLLDVLEILNRPELAALWSEDETLGWVYQYFNGDAERKKMREESAAPRNSRELAVRNQFFTPRYVVEFLTDNTLGRIWYEMRKGKTVLKERCRYLVRRPNEVWLQPREEAPGQADTDEALKQEELLHQPEHVPHRPLKDPREIRMLDPACGSMHFGLYAFDLYLEIYAEAWDISQESDEPAKTDEAFAPFVAYIANFGDKSAFLREVPRLILLHNIHGIDIDPRATQIARLTLWLRAQRAWQEQRLQVANRPPITRSNVVCAEPMPGESELLADFVDHHFPDAERGIVQQLLETIFGKMKLAGEIGSLLKIEEEISDAINQARREWQKLAVQQQDLFSPIELEGLGQVGSLLNTDLQHLTKDFWLDIEQRIYAALRDYAEQAENSGGFQRRLFAEDASHGFAFIDACRKRYDLALMNPPFGALTPKGKRAVKISFANTWKDAYAAFVERLLNLLTNNGLFGAVTPNSWLYSRQLSEMRSSLVSRGNPRLLVELGQGVMDDATVEASIWTASAESTRAPIMTLDLLYKGEEDYKAEMSSGIYSWSPSFSSSYAFIEGQPICHHLNKKCLALWRGDSRLTDYVNIAKGNTSFDDFRFVRTFYEAPSSNDRWVPYRSGGVMQPFYASTSLRIDWRKDGAAMRAYATFKHGSEAQAMQSMAYWKRPGISYPRVGSGFGARLVGEGEIFSGNSIYISCPDQLSCFALAGILNSSPICALLKAHGRFRNTETVSVKDLPLRLEDFAVHNEQLDALARKATSVVQHYSELLEEDPIFNPVTFLLSCNDLSTQSKTAASQLKEQLLAIDVIVNNVLELQEESLPPADSYGWEPEQLNGESTVARLLSFMLGCLFGRWEIGTAARGLKGAERRANKDSTQSHQLAHTPYPTPLNISGIAEHGFIGSEDIAAAIKHIVHNLDQDGAISSYLSDRISEYASTTFSDHPEVFFERHLAMYSESRRSAPIYWCLSLACGEPCIWLYIHSATRDTLYRIIDDYMNPEIDRLKAAAAAIDSDISAVNPPEKEELLRKSYWLSRLREEIHLVAPLWNPNLNDGVIINHAILWRITPYTPWQKKCKECWDKLVKGDYDWAHLSFHLWPERVIPKCTTDRSLAIAHGLEERLWQETNNGNWLPRQLSEADLKALISEHTKPAVKNALERFLAAPPPVASSRTRAPRATRSSASGTTRRPRGTAAVVDAEASRQTLIVLTASPAEGLSRNAIAELLGVEAASLTAVIKQLKEAGQIEQLGAARGARYRLTETGRAAVEQVEAG